MKLAAGSSRCAARLFLRRAHFNCSHRRLGIFSAFINCIASQCYRSYGGDRSLIDDTTFLCREITHDIKFCSPNRRRNQQDYDCNQGPFHCDLTAQSEQSSSTSGSLRYMTVITSWYVQLEHSKVRRS